MKTPFTALACLLVIFTASSGARELPVTPAWELIAAESGLPATVEIRLPETTPIHSLDRVEIPGADIRDMIVLTEDQAIRVRLNDTDGEPVFIDSLILHLGKEQRTVPVIPVEVRWLNQDPESLLQTPFIEILHTTPMVIAVVARNFAADPITLTDFRFAPLAVSTGKLLLARDVELVAGRPDLELPYAPDGTLTYNPEDREGARFEEFNFSEGGITLAAGAQVLLLASGESVTQPELFNDFQTTEWAPWLEFRHGGQVWHHVLYRSWRTE